jgi:hypothetical protein
MLTLHLYISGPSKLNGSFSSGVHFISYSFVSTEFEKYSFGEKWNSKTKPYKKIVQTRNMPSLVYYSGLSNVRIKTN